MHFAIRKRLPTSVFVTQEREQDSASFPLSLNVPTTGMARGPLGGGSRGGGATLEKQKLSFKQEVKTVEPKLSNDGGGGNNGNKIFNGGGGEGEPHGPVMLFIIVIY
jgi:hypothetical protein